MDGLSEVREKLEDIQARTNGVSYNLGTDVSHLAHEALALLEAEPGEQMRRDHEAMEKLREAGGSLHHWGESDGRWVWTVYSTIRTKQVVSDPADAILGAPTDGEGT